MSIAKIIAPLTGGNRDKTVLATAFLAAKPFAAHVLALYVRPDPRLAIPYMGAPLSPDLVQAIIDSVLETNKAAAKAARAALKDAAQAAGIELLAAPRKMESASCSFREVEGFFPRCVAHEARLSDLIVFGPVTADDGPDLADAFVETLLKSERPVLLAAKTPTSLTGKVTLAWDGSAVAARALVGAMPFLKQAGKITLLSCRRPESRKTPFGEVEEYLALHGLSCAEEVIDPGKRPIGEALLDGAMNGGADLLVMGGYGHSQWGETLFGGVTQHVRWHAALPVLMFH